MRDGMTGTDAYLEQWRRADPVPVEGDDPAEAADTAVERLETQNSTKKNSRPWFRTADNA